MRRLLGFVLPYWPSLAAGLICVVAITAANLFVPRYLGLTVDAMIRTRSLRVLNTAALVILLAFALRSALLYGQIFFGFFLGHRVIADLRYRIFERVQRWSLDRFARWTSGDLIARSLQDTQVMQQALLGGLLEFAGIVLLLGGIVVMLFLLQWRLALFTLVVIPVLLASARLFGHEIQRVSVRAQERAADLASLLRQAFGGARIIRAFAQEERELGRFWRENERSFREGMRIGQLIAAQIPVVSFFTALGLVAVLWQGGRLVTAGVLSPGTLVSFLAYAAVAVDPAIGVSRVYAQMRQGLGALDRVVDLLRVPDGVRDSAQAVEVDDFLGAVRFSNVSFAYDGVHPVLHGVTLQVAPGERIAIVGHSGAGKSTLVNLIPRFYDPVEGAVEVDGRDVRTIRLRSLRSRIGLVPQETVLFIGTIRDNIAYARPAATDEEIIEASRVANAHDFIMALPDGYETVLSEDGVQLSGGQRQRVAIARAVLSAPRIIILDEATSALDADSERLIQEALDRLMEERTTFIIAHRLSTVRKADRIIVLDRGRLVEQGRHDDLLAQDGVYARLARLQLLAPPVATET